MTMSDNNLLTNTLRNKQRFLIHWILGSLTSVLAVISFVLIFLQKQKQDELHFQTAHSWLGLPTICLTLLSICFGVWLKLTLATRFKKMIHSFLGIFTYTLALITIIVGIHSTIDSVVVATPLTVILVILIFYVLMKPLALAVSRLKDLLRQ
jgi:type IV secretory pathway VirB2 component (pilin)